MEECTNYFVKYIGYLYKVNIRRLKTKEGLVARIIQLTTNKGFKDTQYSYIHIKYNL